MRNLSRRGITESAIDHVWLVDSSEAFYKAIKGRLWGDDTV